jgi:uncharacterized protein (TIGR03435 family)
LCYVRNMTARNIAASLLAWFLGVAVVGPAMAQEPRSFEAVSIRPNESGDGGMMFQILPGGRFRALNTTVRELLRAAYQFELERFQIVGGPSWVDSDRFDIQATVGGDASPEQMSAMVRSLLVERFGLATRRETRELPIFHLVARDDRRPGPQLAAATGNCVARDLARPSAPDSDNRPPCGFSFPPDAGDLQHMVGTAVTMEQLAQRLRMYADGMVVDRTGLTGRFDLRLEYMPASVARSDPGVGVSIFTAVQEQLGLRLQSTRGPVEVLVVERVERPSAN